MLCCRAEASGRCVQLDDVMGTAEAVTGSLGEQRRIFDNIGGKLISVSSKFPLVNGVMNAIRRKKSKVSVRMSRESFHVGSVAFCSPLTQP